MGTTVTPTVLRATPAGTAARAGSGGMSVRVLVVDDDRAVRRLLKRVLVARGFEAETTGSVAEARELLAERWYEVALCDVRMPGETGIELARELAATRPEIATIMISGQADRALVDEAIELGIYGYFLKPIDIDELVINIASAVRRRSLEVESRRYRELLELELSRSRDALGATEDRFLRIIENVPGALYSRSATEIWNCTFLSDPFAEVTGYAPSRFLGPERESLAVFVQEDDRERVEREVAAAVALQRPFSVAYRIRHADGSEQWVGERGRAAYDEAGEAIAIDGTMSNITERKRLEEERDRIQAELRLAQKLEAVGQLAAGIAHEINTPIQFVGDSVAFLNEAYGSLRTLHERYRELIADADREAVAAADQDADLGYLLERIPVAFTRTFDGIERVASIVRAMKNFAHTSEVELAPADINDAIRTTLTVARSEYKYLADVQTELSDVPLVSCNISDIGQVMLNLIVNAAHAIEDAARGERGSIRIGTTVEGPDVVIAVSDTGCGIPPADLDRVFEPFFTTKEVGRGSGQGLALARSIADRHGGLLTCESVAGIGTTFTMRLPIEQQKPHIEEAA